MRYSIHEMEQRVLGRHADKVAAIRRWVIRGRVLPKADLADVLQIPVSVFDGVLDLIEAHPDWDDEDVANEASWR